MDIYHVIERPLVTEKSTHQSRKHYEAEAARGARGGAYSFRVHAKANKEEIRQAVEKIYGVKVIDVRTSNRKGKSRRYRYHVGTTPAWKKAVVVLHPDSHLDLF